MGDAVDHLNNPETEVDELLADIESGSEHPGEPIPQRSQVRSCTIFSQITCKELISRHWHRPSAENAGGKTTPGPPSASSVVTLRNELPRLRSRRRKPRCQNRDAPSTKSAESQMTPGPPGMFHQIFPLCHDVRDTSLSRFSAVASASSAVTRRKESPRPHVRRHTPSATSRSKWQIDELIRLSRETHP